MEGNTHWKPKIKGLEKSKVEKQDKIPTLELKPLPKELKYAFLGENSSYPVVISSTFTFEQEGKLIKLLKSILDTFLKTLRFQVLLGKLSSMLLPFQK